jgi:hypothetical protein
VLIIFQAGTFHPDHKDPAFIGRAMPDTSHEGHVENPDHIFWERVGMNNDTEFGINVAYAVNNDDVAVGGVGTASGQNTRSRSSYLSRTASTLGSCTKAHTASQSTPAGGDQFRTIVQKFPENRDLDFNNPPYVGQGVWWDLDFPGGPHCWYESRANDPGHLVCDGGLNLPFKKDAGNGGNAEGTYHCWKSRGIKTTHWWFHPAWVLEYGGNNKAEIAMQSTPTHSSD